MEIIMHKDKDQQVLLTKWKRELAELKESQKQRSGTRERSYTKNAEEVRDKEIVKKLKKSWVSKSMFAP